MRSRTARLQQLNKAQVTEKTAAANTPVSSTLLRRRQGQQISLARSASFQSGKKNFDGLLKVLQKGLDLDEATANSSVSPASTMSTPSSSPAGRRSSTLVLKQFKAVDTAAKKKKYRRILEKVDLFKTLSAEDREKIIDHLKVKRYPPGAYICRQGDVGNTMYIVEGPGSVCVTKNDPTDPENEEKETVLKDELPVGTLFGELALMTDSRRSANIKANANTTLMYITSEIYNKLFQEENNDAEVKRRQILEREILEKIAIFAKYLSHIQRSKITECMRPSTFSKGDYICKEGEVGESFYIILKGHVNVTVNDPGEVEGERIVSRLHPNDYFGEMALLEDCPRAANCVVASEKVIVMELHKLHFETLLPQQIKNMMRQEMELTRAGLVGSSDAPRSPKSNRKTIRKQDFTRRESIDFLISDFGADETNGAIRTDAKGYALRHLRKFVRSISSRRNDYCFINMVIRHINDHPQIRQRVESFVVPLIEARSSMEKVTVAQRIFKTYLVKPVPARTSTEVLFFSQVFQAAKVMQTVLSDFTPSQIGDLARCASYEVIERGNTIIYEKGDLGETAYFILSGAVRVLDQGKNGIKELQTTLRAGNSFGELGVIGISVRPVCVVTTIRTELLKVNRKDYVHAKHWERNEVMSLSRKTSILGKTGLFDDWANDMLFQFSFRFKQETFDAGSLIVQQGRFSEGLYIIVEGTVSVWQGQQQQASAKPRPHRSTIVGKRRFLNTISKGSRNSVELSLLGPGNVFGYSLVDPQKKSESCSYVAKTLVNLLVLPSALFKSEISDLSGTQLKTRHRSTLNKLMARFNLQKQFWPERRVQAQRTKTVVEKVDRGKDWAAIAAEKKFHCPEDWFVELKYEKEKRERELAREKEGDLCAVDMKTRRPKSASLHRRVNTAAKKHTIDLALERLAAEDRRASIVSGKRSFQKEPRRYDTFLQYLDDVDKRKRNTRSARRPRSALMKYLAE